MAGNTLFEQMEIYGFASGWAKVTIEVWQKELKKRKIGITDELYNSFKSEVQKSQSELIAILLKFKLYGVFRDMGVGRGLKAYERLTNKANATAVKQYGSDLRYNKRTPKRWLNKKKMGQIYRLRELLAERMNTVVSENIRDQFASQPDYNINFDGQ